MKSDIIEQRHTKNVLRSTNTATMATTTAGMDSLSARISALGTRGSTSAVCVGAAAGAHLIEAQATHDQPGGHLARVLIALQR